MSRNKTEKDCISYCKWRLFALSSPASRWRVWPTHSFSCKCPFKGYLSNFLPTTLLQSTSPPAQRLPRVLLYTRTFQLIHCSNLTHFSLNYLFIYIYLSSREGPAWVKLKAARTRMELVRECMNMREGWPLNLTKLFKGQKIGSYLLSCLGFLQPLSAKIIYFYRSFWWGDFSGSVRAGARLAETVRLCQEM